MKKIITALLCALIAFGAGAKKNSEPLKIKVGTYNLCTSDSRIKSLKKGKFVSQQQLWCNSYVAAAAMVVDLDCDVIGFNEVCDSIWGIKGDKGIRDEIERQQGKEEYQWVLYPNTNKQTLSYDSAIGFKKDKFKLIDDGIFWLGGYPEKPERTAESPRGTTRPAVYVKLKHKASGKVFYFVSTHLVLGTMYKDGGTEYNASNCIDYLTNVLIPEKVPSIIAGDFNCDVRSDAFNIMCSSRWADTYLYLKGQGAVGKNETSFGTQPLKDESGFGKWRPDHIMFDKANMVPTSIHIDRRKFPTVDGTEHFPSDHLPVTAEITIF